MKSLLKFLLIFAVILGASAILAPLLFKILPFKFERIFNRLVMIFTLVACFAFIRFRKEAFSEMGLRVTPAALPLFFTGFTGGVAILTLLAFLKGAFGIASLKAEIDWGSVALKILQVFPAACLIGFLEEFFFRGYVYRTLNMRWRWPVWLAVVVTTLFYSAVHFVNAKKPFIGPDPGLKASLKLILAPILSFTGGWGIFWRDFIGLFFFGLVLTRLVFRTKSLWASIGLHAGCVFFVKMDGLFVEFSNTDPLLWGSAKMYDSVAGWAFLALMGAVLPPLAVRIRKRFEPCEDISS